METFGYSTKIWEAAKDEIKSVLVEPARNQQMTAYSQLVRKVRSIELQARDLRLDELLRQIATEEYSEGRGRKSHALSATPKSGFLEEEAVPKSSLWVSSSPP